MEESTPDTSGAKYKDLILETIDQLRKRKARPDLERISHMVERKYKISCEETQADLEKLVKADIVIKVDYKGSTSYRNAAKWKKSYMIASSSNPSDVSRKLFEAVKELSEEAAAAEQPPAADGDAPTPGVLLASIEKWLSDKGTYSNLRDKALRTALGKEVDAGRLVKLSNGNYECGDPKSNKTPSVLDQQSKSKGKTHGAPGAAAGKNTSPSQGSPKKRASTSGTSAKRKRIKKTHGPEFESYEVTKSKSDGGPKAGGSGRVTPVLPSPVQSPVVTPSRQESLPAVLMEDDLRCDFCRLTEDCNRNGVPEDLLVCKDCQAKAHPSCMDYSEDLARRARNSPWQCIDCKTCYICQDSNDPDAMLFCDACDKGYHMTCHDPPVKEKPTGKWVCQQCVQELGLTEEEMEMEASQANTDSNHSAKQEEEGASGLPTPRDSPIQFKDNSMNGVCLPRLADTLPTVVPDASEWSIDEVVKFFKDVGFVEQAEVFREQEIDGKSLLLMKRSDVLTGLSLKLGPALKIYAHVQRLQTRGHSIF